MLLANDRLLPNQVEISSVEKDPYDRDALY